MRAVGIDIGTTSICGVRLDTRTGTAERVESRANSGMLPPRNGWEREQDPEAILREVESVLDELMCGDTGVIGLTGQMHGIVYLGSGGRSVSPLYTWQDARGGLPFGEGTYAGELGCAPGYGWATDFYNHENSIIPDNAAGFCTIHDYAAARLCGLAQPVIHASDAASFGLYSRRTASFATDKISSGAVCERFCARVASYPYRITDECELVGRYRGALVAAAVGDNQASFVGAGGDGETALVNIGTGGQVSAAADPCVGKLADGLELRPLCGEKNLIVGSTLCGGRAFALFHKFCLEIASLACPGDKIKNLYPQLDGLIEKLLERGGTLEIDTAFSGTRADPLRRGSIANLSDENFTPGEFALGILAGEANELYSLYRLMNKPVKKLVGSGNGVRRSRALRRLLGEKFGMPLYVAEHTEEAAYGAALYALTAAGEFSDLTKAANSVRLMTDII